MDRRYFLRAAATLSAGSAALARGIGASSPHFDFPAQPRQRIAIATYPFSGMLDPHKGSTPLLDFPRLVVERFGVFSIEPLDDHFPSTDPAYLSELSRALSRSKVRIANIPVGLGGSIYDVNESKRNQAMTRARHWIQVAHTLNSPSLRMHLEGTKRRKTDPEATAANLRILAETAEEKQVVIHLENDSPTTEDAFLLGKIITAANTPWVRALPDFGNAMAAGKGEDFNYQSVTEMFRYAYGICHVKDSLRFNKTLFSFSLPRLLEIAKNVGYRGYFSIEYDAGGDPGDPTQKLIQATLQALS